MKRYILLLLLLGVSVADGFGQDKTKRTPPNIFKGKRYFREEAIIPSHDTVIMRGEEIEIGGWLFSKHIPAIEIDGFGKSKKKDLEKGIYVIKQKPKKTTTYKFFSYEIDGTRDVLQRTVYVAKNEEEKKEFEKLARQKEEEKRKLLKGKRRPDGGIEIDMSKFRNN